MSTSQEKSNATMMPVPDITLVSDSEDEEVIDLEAIARAAAVKLEKDLEEAKRRHEMMELHRRNKSGQIDWWWQRRKRRTRKWWRCRERWMRMLRKRARCSLR